MANTGQSEGHDSITKEQELYNRNRTVFRQPKPNERFQQTGSCKEEEHKVLATDALSQLELSD
jgi:hypothetical protein